jgi:NADH:ubiquinone oxidoreductase subunit F (NADH-binding)
MRRAKQIVTIDHVKKATSQGRGGRGRRIKVAMSTMNKHKKRSHKRYGGQGR